MLLEQASTLHLLARQQDNEQGEREAHSENDQDQGVVPANDHNAALDEERVLMAEHAAEASRRFKPAANPYALSLLGDDATRSIVDPDRIEPSEEARRPRDRHARTVVGFQPDASAAKGGRPLDDALQRGEVRAIARSPSGARKLDDAGP